MSQQTPPSDYRSISTTPPPKPTEMHGPYESRARTSLTNKFKLTDKESPDTNHAEREQENLGPDEKEKLKSLKAKNPGLAYDPGHVEEEQQVAKRPKPKDKHHAGHLEAEALNDQMWIISIEDMLDKAGCYNEARPWAKHCIYRIPPQLLDADAEYIYYPQAVTLGPYHDHTTKRVKDMEFHKWRALQCTLQRTNHPIQLYLNRVKKLEKKARACYQGNISRDSNQFAEMMVLDSCFILDIFRGVSEGFTKLCYPENDPVFAMRATMHLIQGDMVMLENQIPLFVLDKILKLQTGEPKGTVAKLAIKFLDPLTPTDRPETRRNEIIYDSFADGLHCLDVFRRYLLDDPTRAKHTAPRSENQTNTMLVVDKREQLMVHCAIELKEAGIKFKRLKTDRFCNIQYEKGVLKIPRLLIHDGTKSLLMNLIAYERSHVGCTKEVTAYVIFMDNLIGTAADVSFLHRRGIIEHWLGNDQEVANLFRQLNRACQEVVFGTNGNYLLSVAEQVNNFYNGKWNNWVANLNHNYFTNPWTIISLLAAVVLLLLTFAQTFYTVYGYYWPS